SGVPCYAVIFDLPATELRARNKARGTTVPTAVLSGQVEAWPAVRQALDAEGFVAVHPPGPVHLVPASLAGRATTATPIPLRFGLQLPRFTWPGGPAEIAPRLKAIAG